MNFSMLRQILLGIPFVLFGLACTDTLDRQLTATAPHPTPMISVPAGLVISDTNATPGSIITVTAYESDQEQASATSFLSRLQFDTAQLTYLGPVERGDGVRAINAVKGELRAAGASVHGFSDRVLFSARFRVNATGATRSLEIVQPLGDGAPPVTGNLIGDASADGVINPADALLILSDAAGIPTSASFSAAQADANMDGSVTALDAQILLSYIVGLDVSQFRVGDDIHATPITVTSVTPATLVPGATAVITGTNFAAASADTVFIDSLAMPIVAATSTQLTVSVPAMLPCRPLHTALVRVRSAGAGKSAHVAMDAATAQILQPSQVRILDASSIACVEFAGPGDYLVTVFNAARHASTSTSTSVKVVGEYGSQLATSQSRVPPVTATRMIPAQLQIPAHQFAPPSPTALRHIAALRRRDVAHARFMQHERDLLKRLRARGAQPLRRGRSSRAAAVPSSVAQSRLTPLANLYPPVSTSLGGMSTIKIPDTTFTTYTTIRARTAYVGQHCIVLEDSSSVLYGTIDASYAKLGAEFDQVIYPILIGNFGNPLAMDANLDNNGRIIMLFSPVINQRFPDLSGFVNPCDFFDDTDCAPSNKAEIFYAVAPTSQASDYSDGSVNEWMWNTRAVVAHEAKHIVSFAEKLSRAGANAYEEESWLEEGTAQISSELYGRTIYGSTNAPWKGDATYEHTLYCDLRPEWPECAGRPLVMLDHFSWLYDWGQDPESQSVLDDGHEDGTIYGSAWLFSRWLTDTYATNEGTFLKAITQTTTTYGVANIEAQTGASWPQLLGEWSLAVATDDQGAQPLPSIQSWNLPEIFLSMDTDVHDAHGNPIFFDPWLRSSSPFVTTIADTKTLAGGAFSIYRLNVSGSNDSRAIGVLASDGTRLPSGSVIGMAMARVD